ncbi:MAG TPA: hypothetical protein VKC61_20670 [Pyrinomonadaceae bacterium]|nr:hypothetical protein [Pyrinomonadaceae bacterium]
MAHYFPGRRQVGDKIQLNLDSGKARLDCCIFEYWLDNMPGCAVYCGDEVPIEVVKTVGITTKSSETLESTVEGSIGVTGLTQLKSQLKGVVGHEVSWTRTVSTKMTFTGKAPKCGKDELTIYQLVREYELSYFRRGSWPFRSNVWDHKWTKTIIEETEKYDSIPDKTEYDERCGCETKESPDYDGRLCFDFDNLSLRVPYKLTLEGFNVRIAEHVISFTFSDYAAGMRGLDHKLSISIATAVIPPALKFLGGIEGTEIDGVMYKYVDPSAKLWLAASEDLISLATFHDIHTLPAEAKT